MKAKNDEKNKNRENQSENSNANPVDSKSTGRDKVRKKAEHESGISRGSIVTPNSNSNAGRDI
jgi:hypothetical protein